MESRYVWASIIIHLEIDMCMRDETVITGAYRHFVTTELTEIGKLFPVVVIDNIAAVTDDYVHN